MPISHSQAVSNEATVTLEVYGGQLNLVYYPSKVTDEFLLKFGELERIQGSKTAEEASSRLMKASELMVYVMKSWDYFEDDEQTKMWPLTVEALSKLDFVLKMHCLYAIMGHMRPEGVTPQTRT